MSKTTKNLKILALFLLTSGLFIAALNSCVPNVKAQGTDTVVVFSSIGGTTDPDVGSYNYSDGSTQTFTATAGDGFIFQNWEIATASGSYSDTDNPLSLTLNETQYAIQANFQTVVFTGPVNVTLNMATDAIVVVLGAVGGTVSPTPGTYALASATTLNLVATPASGWIFSHWVIGGSPMNHGAYSFTDTPTDNPYNVNHGYGNTYTYQAVFTPVSSSTSPTPTSTVPEYSSAAAVLVAAILLVVAFGVFSYSKKARK
ncbi:MAG: InlB B-repeat-containing protein [Candidatus Bathyarchaeia archaeon]